MYTPARITKKIGKESITFHFGIGAFHMFCEKRGAKLEEIQAEFTKDQMGALADILSAGANFHKALNDEQEIYTRAQAFLWIEMMSEQTLEDIMSTLQKVQVLGKSALGEEKKKNPTAASRGKR